MIDYEGLNSYFLRSVEDARSDKSLYDVILPACATVKTEDELIAAVNKHSDNVETWQAGLLAFQLFVQHTVVGPDIAKESGTWTVLQREDLQASLHESLALDGTVFTHRVDLLALLVIAKTFLENNTTPIGKLWRLRVLSTHQQLLADPSPTLRDIIIPLLGECVSSTSFCSAMKERNLLTEFYCEAAEIASDFFERKLATRCLDSALKSAGLEIHFDAALGKRTKYQTFDVAQLFVRLEQQGDGQHSDQIPSQGDRLALGEGDESEKDGKILPMECSMQDDVLLSRIRFSKDDNLLQQDLLPPQQQLVVLASFRQFRRTRAMDECGREQLIAFLEALLHNTAHWAVKLTALYERSVIEGYLSARKAERAMLQLEELFLTCGRAQPPAVERMSEVFAARPPSPTVLQHELGNVLLGLGALASALEIFERLHMWDAVIECCTKTGRSEKAEQLIRAEIAKSGETPQLLTQLGDATKEPDCYRRAWRLSNGRFGRAQRQLAFHLFSKDKLAESLDSFAACLAINALQTNVWFTYGCAALRSQRWETARTALQRCCALDYDNHEAWANLATAHRQLGGHERAYNCLQEAVRSGYENWRLWENYLVVATEICAFNSALKAYNRLLDLKPKYCDLQMLHLLVNSVESKINDRNGTSVEKWKKELRKLFRRITDTALTQEASIWRLYADLVSLDTAENDEMGLREVHEYLEKCHSCDVRQEGWSSNVLKTTAALWDTVRLLQSAINVYGDKTNESFLGSARLAAASTLKQIRMDDIAAEPGQLKRVAELMSEVEELYAKSS